MHEAETRAEQVATHGLTRLSLERFFAAYRVACSGSGLASNRLTARLLRQFFAEASLPIARARAQHLAAERKQATRFNVFDLIEPDENKLSDVLVDLLDPKGKHGQGDLFLRLLVDQLAFGWRTNALASARVEREAATYALRHNHRRRIDILVEAGFMLAVENKKASAEQPRQVKDYLAHLARCAASSGQAYTLIYLTPDHHLPPSLTGVAFWAERRAQHLICWSYQRELRQWLEQCRQQCQAPKMQHFLSDFMAYTTTVLKREEQEDETENNYEC